MEREKRIGTKRGKGGRGENGLRSLQLIFSLEKSDKLLYLIRDQGRGRGGGGEKWLPQVKIV
jgi:hypothetical protein